MSAGPLHGLTEWLTEIAGNWWFLVVITLFAVFDSVVPVIPSETAVIIGGVVAASGGQAIGAVIACAAIGAFLGDNLAYEIGRFASGWLDRRAERRPAFGERLAKAGEQIHERGGLLLVTARFIPGGRTVLTLSCGITRQRWRWFAPWVCLAALIWGTYAALLGYLGGSAFENNHTAAFLLAFGGGLAVTGLSEIVRRIIRRAKSRAGNRARAQTALLPADQPWNADRVVEVNGLWDYDDPAGSERRFRDAAATAEPEAATVYLTQAARALGLQERYADADALLDGLEADSPEARVRIALERGRLRRSSGDPASAIPLFEAAARAGEEADLQALTIDALHMIALSVPADEQVAAGRRALAAAQAATDPTARNWDASIINNIGMAYAEADDFTTALDTFYEALRARERIGDDGRTRVAKWMVAWALRNLGRREEALTMQRALKAEFEAAGEHDQYVDEEIALLTE